MENENNQDLQNTEEIDFSELSTDEILEKLDKPEEAEDEVEVTEETTEEEPEAATEEESQKEEEAPTKENVSRETNEESEETSEESDEDKGEETNPFEEYLKEHPIVGKSKGLEVPFKSLEELQEAANKATRFTQVMQQVAPLRKTTEYLKKHEISMEELQMLAEIKKGNLGALNKLAELNNIDQLDSIDQEYNPSPDTQQPSDEEYKFNEVINTIREDGEFDRVNELLSDVPQEMINAVNQSADTVNAFYTDYKSGYAEKAIQYAKEQLVKRGGNFMEHYLAYGDVAQQQNKTQNKTEGRGGDLSQKEIENLKRKASTSVGSKTNDSSDVLTEKDIWSKSSDELLSLLDEMTK